MRWFTDKLKISAKHQRCHVKVIERPFIGAVYSHSCFHMNSQNFMLNLNMRRCWWTSDKRATLWSKQGCNQSNCNEEHRIAEKKTNKNVATAYCKVVSALFVKVRWFMSFYYYFFSLMHHLVQQWGVLNCKSKERVIQEKAAPPFIFSSLAKSTQEHS